MAAGGAERGEAQGPDGAGRPSLGAQLAVGLTVCAAQLLAVVILYQVAIDFSCRDAVGPGGLCAELGDLPARAVAVAAAAALFVLARPTAVARFADVAVRAESWAFWARVQLVGFAILLTPAAAHLLGGVPLYPNGLLAWLAGAAAASVGAVFWIAPPAVWRTFLREQGPAPVLLALAAAALPDAVTMADPLWRSELVTRVTFDAVLSVLTLFADAEADPARYVIGVEDFVVQVAASCSGVQGFALIGAFVAIYLWLFRDALRLPHALVLFPIGLALSWVFNILRIVTLILLGAYHSPALAVDGFHSHAGWLFFTLIALGFLVLARRWRWVAPTPAAGAHASARRAPPLLEDPNAALILPFIVFMATALLASTFLEAPALAYPLRAAAMAAALWAFRAHYRRLEWRADPLALGVGAAIGLAWVLVAPPADAADAALAAALAAMGPAAFALWAASRVIGTVALAPLIEELFFRGYLQRSLDVGGGLMRIVAVVLPAAAFAALHGRWLEAGVAGLAFGLVMMRSGRLADAVLAHAVANAVIAAWALATGGWHVI